MNILVIDDRTDTLEIIRDLLEAEGFNVLTCAESHESFKILKENKVHCIVTDLKMPILEGNDLIQIIKGKYPHIPIIVLSGHIDSREAIVAAGAYEALRKPIDAERLVACVQESLSETSDTITFQFHHTNLKDIKSEVTKRLVRLALRKSKGNKLRASEILGIPRQSLIRYIHRYNLSETSD